MLMTDQWTRWLSRLTVACAVAVPVLLVVTFSIHVPGDRCQYALANRPGLSERYVLWALALVAALLGLGISLAGLSRRRWAWGFGLVVFVGELAIVGIAALGLDPCGLS